MANKGQGLENLIQLVNRQYLLTGRAVVQKVPTPTTVRWAAGQIVGAKHTAKSTVDFVGCLAPSGRFVAFDAKQNGEETRFPLNHDWAHEVEFLRYVHRAGGITFLIIEQTQKQQFFLVPGPALFEYWDGAFNHYGPDRGRRSIPVHEIEQRPIESSVMVPVDWLGALKRYGLIDKG